MNEKDKIDSLCENLLHDNGQEEQAVFEDWKAEHPDNQKMYEVLARIEISSEVSEYAESVRGNIFRQLNSEIDRRSFRLHWLKVSVAIVLALVLLGGVGYFSYNEGYKKQSSQLVTYENPLGIKSSIVLPDGSKVILNAGSTLTYPTIFVGKERKVIIRGEGFFEVMHDDKHPFIVSTNDIQVKVLGTKFNVKAYNDETDIEVTLSEGSVCIGLAEGNPYIILEPCQQVRFDKVKRLFSKRNVDLNNYTGWKDGKFYFNSVTFQNIARQLERKFNVHIYIASEQLQNTVFSGEFVRGENLEQILRVMAIDTRIKYRIDGDLIYIK